MSEAQYAAGEHMFAAVHPFVPSATKVDTRPRPVGTKARRKRPLKMQMHHATQTESSNVS